MTFVIVDLNMALMMAVSHPMKITGRIIELNG